MKKRARSRLFFVSSICLGLSALVWAIWSFLPGPSSNKLVSRIDVGYSDEVIQVMLEDGADPNGSISGYTPLMAASFRGRRSTVGILLRAGARITETRDPVGSPLRQLIRGVTDDAELAMILMKNGERGLVCRHRNSPTSYSQLARQQNKLKLSFLLRTIEGDCT